MTATSARTAATTGRAHGRGRRHELLECFRAATRSAGRIYHKGLLRWWRELHAPRLCPETDDKPAAVGDESDRAVLYPSI